MKHMSEIFAQIPIGFPNISILFHGAGLFSKFYSIFPKEGTLTGKNADSTMEARKVTDKERIFSQKERKDENGDSCIR